MSIEAFDAAMRALLAGRHAEALERLVAFYESATASSSLKNSSCLDAFMRLAHSYPEARRKLEEMRDERAEAIGADAGMEDVLHDVLAMNDYLGDMSHSLALIQRLHVDNPRLVALCKGQAMGILARGGDFALARAYLGDPVRELHHVADVQNALAEHHRSGSGPAWQLLMNVQRYVDALHLITGILHAQGEERLATQVLVLAPGLLADPDERAALDREYEHPGIVQRELEAALAQAERRP
jgi:hypothetical protein